MYHLLLVGLGGCLGAMARFKLSGWVLHHSIDWKFPLGTFVVNVLGCLVAGVLAGLAAKHDWFSNEVRLFLLTGLMGGFTTFSAFGLDTVSLLKRGEVWVAASYVGLSVFCGIVVFWLGMAAIAVRPSDV